MSTALIVLGAWCGLSVLCAGVHCHWCHYAIAS
jgi:hypothetical protein